MQLRHPTNPSIGGLSHLGYLFKLTFRLQAARPQLPEHLQTVTGELAASPAIAVSPSARCFLICASIELSECLLHECAEEDTMERADEGSNGDADGDDSTLGNKESNTSELTRRSGSQNKEALAKRTATACSPRGRASGNVCKRINKHELCPAAQADCS
jgi:hypothetical protein